MITHVPSIALIVKLNLKLQCYNYWSRSRWYSNQLDERNKGVIFKNCAPFTDCISGIFNAHIDNAKYKDVVMPMYNLIEYSDNYSKTSGSLWKY